MAYDGEGGAVDYYLTKLARPFVDTDRRPKSPLNARYLIRRARVAEYVC